MSPCSSRPSREDKRQIPSVDSAVEVEIEAGEVIEDLHTGVHGLLAPTSHIGAASLFVAAALITWCGREDARRFSCFRKP
jgi:hypothetical protein